MVFWQITLTQLSFGGLNPGAPPPPFTINSNRLFKYCILAAENYSSEEGREMLKIDADPSQVKYEEVVE